MAVCAAGCLVFRAGNWVSVSAAQKELPIYSVERKDKVCALTFDAAWGNEDTQQLIDILKTENIQATFFVVGAWVDKYPESVKALSDAGHEVMNHSATHPHMPDLSTEQMTEEVQSCNEKIKAITGVQPTLFRPPYGDYNNAVISTMRSIGMYSIQWDVDSLDSKMHKTAALFCFTMLLLTRRLRCLLSLRDSRRRAFRFYRSPSSSIRKIIRWITPDGRFRIR